MTDYFKRISELISLQEFDALQQVPLQKPLYFNWVTEVFEAIHLNNHPNKTALLWTDERETHSFTFKDLQKRYDQLLHFLRERGIAPGDVLLTQLMFQPVNWVAVLTAIKGGLQLVPAASILGAHDLAFRFEKTLPKVVISDMDNAEKIDQAEGLSSSAIAVKIIADGEREGWISLAQIEREAIPEVSAAPTKADDNLFLFFTSGTTGLPKIVCHTHWSHPVGHLTTASWIGINNDDIHYNISQPGWAKFAWSSVFAPWNVGATVFAHHTMARFDAAKTLQLIEKHQITTLCAPPTVLRLFIQEDLQSYRFKFRQCVAAGEPLNPEIIEQWKAGTGMLIRDGFGQTESTCMIANLPGAAVKMGSMGKPTFLYEVIIADDQGVELPNNEEGNICIKTTEARLNGLFKGYLYDKERERQVFRNGVYFTGDKAYRDQEGYVWFIGRDDDVIKSSDYRIGPFEVESALLEHHLVLESAVVASPHDVKGFEVKAFVVLSDRSLGSKDIADELFAYSRAHIAPYKMPRLIEFVSELPKTISGKIRRVELRALQAERISKNQIVEREYIYRR
ncbi:acyl-CoA synthetase [Flavobacterium sp. JP2137]|uniref:acyl-CoA synthetase n=1 Tax=Flavobacterium sp. JP2137 TaxID=3414510 RepID=UPI003D2FB998